MNSICKHELCTGCGVCKNVCSRKAIQLVENTELGHIYPEINSQCIDCGLCQKTCPINYPPQKFLINKAYAAWSLDDQARQTSTSGGIADTFYRIFLEENNIVVGASFDNNLNLNMEKCDDIKEFDKFKKSKYCQCNTQYIYKQAKDSIKTGKQVLFIGTPCQCAAIQNYLNEDERKNLYTIDFICHGVPSNKLLIEYVNMITRGKNDADYVSFREKRKYIFSVYNKNKLLYRKQEDFYQYLFINNYLSRESCYNCQYANSERVSDITIGDYWGLGKEKKFEYPCNGVSCVLVNSSKGTELLHRAENKLFLQERPITEVVSGSSQLRNPAIKNPNRDKFVDIYTNCGIKRAIHKTVFRIVIKRRINLFYCNCKRSAKKILLLDKEK